MRVAIVCPFPTGSRLGNRVTAVRWRRLLADLGHDVRVLTGIPRIPYDVLVALHARRTAEAVRWSRATHPERPIIVVLTGTDLYRDIRVDLDARRSLEVADRLLVLHDRAADELPPAVRHKVRLVRQSADPAPRLRPARGPHAKKRALAARSHFDVAFVAHLRPEKDPLRAAEAARLLPPDSRVRIRHAGRALDATARRAAAREQRSNPRYRWLGELPPAAARRLIASSRLMVLTSRMEGGANVLGEAIVSGTPVLASRIPAALSALGDDYPGLFPVGDTRALASLLERAERDTRFRTRLERAVRARRRLFAPAAERAAWRSLLAELTSPTSARRSRRSRAPT